METGREGLENCVGDEDRCLLTLRDIILDPDLDESR